MKLMLPLLMAWVLAGCAGVPLAIDKNAAPAKVAADLGLEAGAVSVVEHCATADAIVGEKLAVYQPCVYAPLVDGAVLLTFDESQARYGAIHRLKPATIRAVAFKEMGRAKQIQIHSNAGFVVVEFLSPSRTWGKPAAAVTAYAHLRSLGIPETDPVQYVFNYRPIRVEVH